MKGVDDCYNSFPSANKYNNMVPQLSHSQRSGCTKGIGKIPVGRKGFTQKLMAMSFWTPYFLIEYTKKDTILTDTVYKEMTRNAEQKHFKIVCYYYRYFHRRDLVYVKTCIDIEGTHKSNGYHCSSSLLLRLCRLHKASSLVVTILEK